MIQDIQPHVLSNAFKPRPPRQGDFVLVYGRDKVWLLEGSRIPRHEQFCEAAPNAVDGLTYLFDLDDAAFFYARSDSLPGDAKKNLIETPASAFRTHAEKWLGFAGITACHLAGWYERHQICGRCGEKTRHSAKERMIECPACALMTYPRISPVVIVGVTDGPRLLLTRYANRPVTNHALVAGFCEIGETIEDTVRREVMEEVGLRVKNIRFYKSQPWGFSGSLLMGFYCDLDGSPDITLDRNELAIAEWTERAAIPIADTSISLTSEMIENFRVANV